MLRRASCAVAAVLALAAVTAATPAQAHQGDPHYLSVVHGLAPSVPGLSVVMLNRNDRLLVTNRGPRTVEFMGYNDDPYLRFLPSGTVQRNTLSPATYLNVDATGTATVPATADPKAPPRWQTVATDGKYEFHDHRIHWMGQSRPTVVKNPEQRTKVQDWRVPFVVAGSGAGAVVGTLYWTPLDGGGVPVGAIVGLVALVLGSVVLVVLVRRRRKGEDGDDHDPDDADAAPAAVAREAW